MKLKLNPLHWLALFAVVAISGCALVACAAPPPWVAPSKPLTLFWTPSTCPPQGNCRPFTYCLFTNDVLVTSSIPETATNYVFAVEPPGITEYALAGSNVAGRSACAVAVGTNNAPSNMAAPPSTLKVQ